MILKWIYKIWTFLLNTAVLLLIGITIAGLLSFAALQLPVTKNYIAEVLTEQFEENYEGTLQVEQIDGILPFRTKLYNVRIFSPDRDETPVVTIDTTKLTVQFWDLLQRNVSIRSFELHQPDILLERTGDDQTSLSRAFKVRERPDRPTFAIDIFETFKIYAPSLLILNGKMNFNGFQNFSDRFGTPDSVMIDNINTAFRLDLTERQRFFDIDFLAADVHVDETFSVSARGQVFSDNQYLELNAFQIRTDRSQIEFTGEATPVDLFDPEFPDQLVSANYRFNLTNSYIQGSLLSAHLPFWPIQEKPLDLELMVEGTLDRLYVDRLIGRVGDSSFHLTAILNNLVTEDFNYETTLTNLLIDPEELAFIVPAGLRSDADALDKLADGRLSGQAGGDLDHIDGRVNIESGWGALTLKSQVRFNDTYDYSANVEFDSLNISPFRPGLFDKSALTGVLDVKGKGISLSDIQAEFFASFDAGFLNHVDFSFGTVDGRIENRALTHQMSFENDESALQTSGSVRMKEEKGWVISQSGIVRSLNLAELLQNEQYPDLISMEYSADLEWSHLDDLFGRVSLDIEDAVIGQETIDSHQFYADLDAPGENGNQRNLRITSSFLDATVRGDIYPMQLTGLYSHWSDYLKDRFVEEFTLDSSRVEFSSADLEIKETALEVELSVKDLEPIRKYFGGEVNLQSEADLNVNLNANRERMLLTGSVSEPEIQFNELYGSGLNASFTANFQHGSLLRDHAVVDLQIDSDQLRYRDFSLFSSDLSFSMRDEIFNLDHDSRLNGEDVSLSSSITGILAPDSLIAELNTFSLGSDRYEWTSEGTSVFTFYGGQNLKVEEMVLVNDLERIELSGMYSDNPDDIVEYSIRNLELQRISDLIGGRVSFSGIVNGDFSTRTLFLQPTFEGSLKVEEARLTDRLIGDITMNSQYSPEEDRFNTEVSIFTDPDRYPDYYETYGSGQDLHLSGYFKTPDLNQTDQDIYYFDADLRTVDMWIATVIVPNILQSVEGSSSGEGYIRGSLDAFDFNAEFDISDVTAVPAFLNTEYNLNGSLEFDRHTGLTFNEMNLRDSQGGMGQLYGNIDLDNFSETTYLDLTLDMQDLHFMNNPYDRDIPFYSSARGSGRAQITGSNFNPYLRTLQPIVLSPGSRISVPVLDEAELQQRHGFIEFVDSFEWDPHRKERGERESALQFDTDEPTFVERFTLDLQFIANVPVNFQLVFDRVTNEILTANSTGQIRLTLEDQNFNMFGRVNISGGDYQFVVGDIISRRFQLLEGGSIIWEGDPANARLDVDATYRARPDLSTLLTTGQAGTFEGRQRVPVDLKLNIGGTLSELENDFYFEVPSNIEGTLDPILLTQVNALNRNEDEKIIQATSLLISGNFIPMASTTAEGGTGMALMETFTGGTVVNPLITSQVINPLLSDQINSLLRSDMALDVDFNLTHFNQIDLGVALRLYDNKLILRRDGEITGPYSDIGDLGATYRINRTFAVTAFHRQDPTLTNTSATEPRQVQEMNGVGVEAQVQFNTWQEIRQRFSNAISRLFGTREEETTDDDLDVVASD